MKKPDDPFAHYSVSSSPHAHSGATVSGIMRDVLIALLPAFGMACWLFGWHAVRLTLLCVVSCMATEWVCRRMMGRANSLGDFSAVLTGVLLAFNLPPHLPGWMAVLGCVFAIGAAKQVYGGLGYNMFNPALIGRAFLVVSFTAAMTTWTVWQPPESMVFDDSARILLVDGLTNATPLGMTKEALAAGRPMPFLPNRALLWNLFVGRVNGSLGETSALALMIGALYLLWRRVISWHIPFSYLATVALYAWILRWIAPSASLPVGVHLLSGGLMLGAFFMATDMVTTPVTPRGMIVFGIGCGLLTMILRTVSAGAYPEGVSFAILLMNAATPLINRATRPRVFGTRTGKGSTA